MTAFAAVEERARRPARTLILEPWVFADEWPGKPSEAVCVGLRLMSELDKTKARAEAERFAIEVHPNGGPNAVDCFNDTLLQQVAAFAICDPNDVKLPSSLFPLAESDVRQALTSRGARYIYEAYHRYEVEVSPLSSEATDAELDELAELIETGDLDLALSEPLVRKFLKYALDEIKNHPQYG